MAIEIGNSMDIHKIMEVLPHRYPLLLVDRITHFETMKSATGYKNLTINEHFFQGHFPGMPLMPGVYIIEALAQLGGTIILGKDDFLRRTAFLTGIDKAKFRRPVIPGDRLDMSANVMRIRKNMGWVFCEAHVDGKLACSAELMFSIATVTNFGMDAAVLHE
ncbi:MAG: 3-hydroxyacyl-ACP dehydratase FabZ [Vulcanimicrobiaceae bacterium]